VTWPWELTSINVPARPVPRWNWTCTAQNIAKHPKNEGPEDMDLTGKTSRRQLVRTGLFAGAATALWNVLGPQLFRATAQSSRSLIACLGRPQDWETPRDFLSTFLTPNDVFFVRSHFGPPPLISGYPGWRLTVDGIVDHPLRLTLEELQKLEKVTLPAVLQCSGAGRSFYRPSVAGVQWGSGAVGNAEWTGVRLREVLELAGLRTTAKHIQLEGVDLPPLPQTPNFVRSIPVERALDPLTLLAYQMNGDPLPHLHGGPLRLIVPGWAGDHWIKWLRSITARETESEGFYMQTAYRIPRTPISPGTTPAPKDMVPVMELNVKSLIAAPLSGAVITQTNVDVSGVAFTGKGKVVRVDLSVDGGKRWFQADLGEQRSPGTWQQWRWRFQPAQAGHYQIWSRATDSSGSTQPETAIWNPSGYLWNGIDRIECAVRI